MSPRNSPVDCFALPGLFEKHKRNGKGRDLKMKTIPIIAKKLLLAAAISAMLPTGFACAMPNTVQDAAIEYKAADYTPDEFLGFWEEEAEGNFRLTVTVGEKGWYGIEVCYNRNKTQVDMWTMTAKPVGKHVLEYSDCHHYLLTYGPQYIDKEEVLYEKGTGTIHMVGTKRVVWKDNQDHIADNAIFIPLRSPLGGGL